jgi:hypothetical protein
MAITSLVLGILAFPGICCYGIPGLALGITAIVLGRISLGKIRSSYGNLGGSGLAQAGWICGLVASILAGVWFLVVVVMGAFSFFTFNSSPSFVTPTP